MDLALNPTDSWNYEPDPDADADTDTGDAAAETPNDAQPEGRAADVWMPTLPAIDQIAAQLEGIVPHAGLASRWNISPSPRSEFLRLLDPAPDYTAPLNFRSEPGVDDDGLGRGLGHAGALGDDRLASESNIGDLAIDLGAGGHLTSILARQPRRRRPAIPPPCRPRPRP